MSKARTILGFGASTMQGAGDSQSGFFARMDKQFQPGHPDWQFVNLGKGGNTTRDMLARADQAEPYQPYDLIVILGCNDLPRERDGNPLIRTTIEEYTANLDTLLPQIRRNKSLFISSFQPDPIRTGVQIATMDTYMAAALGIARKHGYQVWDLYAELREHPDLARYWAADGMHFNDAGHGMIAERVIAWLSK